MAKRARQRISDIKLDLIDEPKAIVRMDIDPDYIAELATSISEIGLLQPILLAFNNGRFEIVAGHCRWLACKQIGLSNIKAVVRDMTQSEIGIARATENITRKDLTPIEEAATYKDLIDTYGLSIDKVARKMGRAPHTIKRRMDLLRMPPPLQKAVHAKQISMSVAEELWAIRDQTSLEYYLIFATENGCTKAVARKWAQEWKDTVRRSQSPGAEGGDRDLSPFEPRPTYIPCDICDQPVELGKDQIIRSCSGCWGLIKKGLEGEA